MPMNTKLGYDITLFLIVSGAAFASSIVAPALPMVVENFNAYDYFVYYVSSVYLLGYLSAQIIYSVIAQIYGYRLALLAGYAVFVTSSFLQVLAITKKMIFLFFCSRFFCAFGAASGLICVFAMINNDNKQQNVHNYISKLFISLTLCSYLSVTIGGYVAKYLGWITVFNLMLVVSIIELILIYLFIPCSHPYPEKNKNIQSIINRFIKSWANLRFLSACLIIAFTTTSTYLYNTVGSSISNTVFNLSPERFGLLSIVNLICLLFGGWVSNEIMKTFSAIRALVVGVFTAFLPIIFFLIFHGKIFSSDSGGWYFFPLVASINIGLGIVYPTASYLAFQQISCNTTASSIMNFLKISCPALLITLLGQSHINLIDGYRYPMLITSVLAVFCTFYLIFTLEKKI